jgi:S1-C subfamily serine protease
MRKALPTLAVVVVSMVLGAAIVGGFEAWRGDDGGKTAQSATADSSQAVSQQQGAAQQQASASGNPAAADYTALYDSVRPSIVEITTGSTGNDNVFAPQRGGLGSGIVLDTAGHVLTNYHVVNGFDKVTVTFADESTAEADVVGKDPGNDVAVVKVNADAGKLHPAKLGDSSAVKVGTVVAAIGNPFGLEGTFTTGVISGLDRTLPSGNDGRPIRGLLQTDTAVNPGNSGGALFNLQGEVIGINTAIENPGGNTFAGVAYAVPINTPKRFMTQLTQGETITHPRLGISGETLTPQEAQDAGVDHGVAVINVESGSAADHAGLKESANGTGDVITAIDGQPMRTFEDLADYVDSKQVGDKVTLTVHRDGKDIELTATLQAWDSSA